MCEGDRRNRPDECRLHLRHTNERPFGPCTELPKVNWKENFSAMMRAEIGNEIKSTKPG